MRFQLLHFLYQLIQFFLDPCLFDIFFFLGKVSGMGGSEVKEKVTKVKETLDISSIVGKKS